MWLPRKWPPEWLRIERRDEKPEKGGMKEKERDAWLFFWNDGRTKNKRNRKLASTREGCSIPSFVWGAVLEWLCNHYAAPGTSLSGCGPNHSFQFTTSESSQVTVGTPLTAEHCHNTKNISAWMLPGFPLCMTFLADHMFLTVNFSLSSSVFHYKNESQFVCCLGYHCLLFVCRHELNIICQFWIVYPAR